MSLEAGNVERAFKRKSLSERVIAEYQTRGAPIRGYPRKTRGEVFRYERGQILKAYKILRRQILDTKKAGEDATGKKNLLQEIRGRAKILGKNLDDLNRQYHESVRSVEIETRLGKFSVPVVELDLRGGEAARGEDKRIPYLLLGTVATNYHSTAALSMSLALEGERVLVPSWPEQAIVGRPADFAEKLGQQQDLSFHKEYAKQTIKSLSLERMKLMGCSMGAAVALKLAQDRDMPEIENLIVIEPPGLERKSAAKLAKDFVLEEGVMKALPYSEARIKTFLQGGRESTDSPGFLGSLVDDGRIIANTRFNAGELATVAPKGRYEVWVGTKSSITDVEQTKKLFGKAQELREQQNPSAPPIEVHVIEGGTHSWPFMNSIGFARLLKTMPRERATTTKLSDLENSGMAAILKDLTNPVTDL